MAWRIADALSTLVAARAWAPQSDGLNVPYEDAMATTATDRVSLLVLAGAALAACGLLLSRVDYVPIWDGRTYADCIVAAADTARGPGALRCVGHSSHAYVALMAAGQLAANESYPMLLVMNAAIYGLACVGFLRLLQFVFPDNRERVDCGLLLAAFIIQPSLLAAVVQPSLDLALLPGFLWCTVCLLDRRLVAAAAIGTAMTFTKETGLLLYAALVASWIVWELVAPGVSARLKSVFGPRLLVLAVPGGVFGGYIAYRVLNDLRPLIGTSVGTGGSFLTQLLVPRLDLYLINFLVLTLILNFAWVPAATVGLDAFVATVDMVHHRRRQPLGTVDGRTAGFVVLLAVTTAFALSRFITYGNSRYYLVTIALLPIAFAISLHRLRVPQMWRWGILSAYATALLVSSVRTIDPLSRAVYGTFQFGSHDMLRMTRVTGECCGMGQDQLAYSLQFTAFHDLVDEALGVLGPPDSSMLIVPDSTSWFQIGPLDARTHRRTLRRRGVVGVPVSEPLAVVALPARPSLAYYLALPNGNNARALSDLGRVYDVGPEQRFERGGYALSAYMLRALRPSK